MGDAAALEQVVVNLLDNALLHTRFGGRVGVQLARSDAGVTLMVTDDGVGITPAMLPIIFEPFVQDVRTLGADGVGLGVGLTVARALARALGGDITAHSGGDEQGSVFVMTLPLADPPSAATRAGGQA
jgi:signal transduction histidine kinase